SPSIAAGTSACASIDESPRTCESSPVCCRSWCRREAWTAYKPVRWQCRRTRRWLRRRFWSQSHPSSCQQEDENSQANPAHLPKSPEEAEGQPRRGPEPERRERGGVGAFQCAEASGDEESGEAYGGAERLDDQRGRERRRNLEHAQEEPGLEGAHEPPEQVKADREREPPPLAPIEALQRPIQFLRARQRVELLDTRQQPRAAGHEPGNLDGQEAARADQLDEQEPEHRGEEPRVDGQRHRSDHADEQEERLRERDRGLGDD